MIVSPLKHLGKLLLRPDYRSHYFVRQTLKKVPRYTPTSIKLFGFDLQLIDSASFLFMYKEIFEQQIYKFKSQNQKPIIIDGGANIGLSILYFKQLYPDSHIVAFEPDIKVFNTLKKNVEVYALSDVTLVNKAIWSSETILEFMAEGADGGRVTHIELEKEKYQVSATRLREYLSKSVDFLKLDIEGAETEVIKDCQDLLCNVSNLFIEYHSFVGEEQTLYIILNILNQAGFRIHIHPPVTSPQPFYYRYINLGMDMQLNIFAFRE